MSGKMANSKSVLVTGGTGFIGSHATVALMEAGYTPVIVDNLSNSDDSVVGRIETITGARPAFYREDLRNEDALNRIFQAHPIDAVIHFAGLKAVGESVAEPLRYYDNNLNATLVLCRVMAAHSVKNLIFSSSATVYGDPPSVPIREDFPLAPTNPYGRSKLMIEEILRDLVIADSTWKIALLRYFNPVGAHESGLIGESPQGIPNNLMPYVSRVASGSLECLSIFGGDYPTPDGTGVRDYIHVMDLAEGHVATLKHLEGLGQAGDPADTEQPERHEHSASAHPEQVENPGYYVKSVKSEQPERCERCEHSVQFEEIEQVENPGHSVKSEQPDQRKEPTRPVPLVVNLGTGRGYSVLEVVHAFEAAANTKIAYRMTDRRPGDIAASYADPTLARRLLHWETTRDLAAMCADAWRFASPGVRS